MLWPIAAFAAVMFLSREPRKAAPAAAPEVRMSDKLAFAARYKGDASLVDMRGIPVDMALAVAGLETGHGTGNVFKKTNSYHNILKTADWGGFFYVSPNGLTYRVYSSPAESIKDFVRLIAETPRYRVAYACAVNRDFKGFFQALQDAGYAGADREYAAKLTRVAGVA